MNMFIKEDGKMPKIVKDAQNRILAAAKNQLLRDGTIAIRKVAQECGISVGSVYNYFDGKIALVVAVLMGDWQNILLEMNKRCENASSLAEGLSDVYDLMNGFTGRYRYIWRTLGSDEYALQQRALRHRELMDYLAQPIGTLLRRFGRPEDLRMVRMLSEVCLTVTITEDLTKDDLLLCGAYITGNT